MISHRKTAMLVGVLFIIATIAGLIGAILIGPVLDDPEYLVNTSAHENEVALAALLTLIMGVAVFGIAVTIFPVLKGHSERIALGYVGFRTLEFVIYITAAMTFLSLLTLSQEYVKAGASDATSFKTQGAILLAQGGWSDVPLNIVFGVECLFFYYVLYTSRLIPRLLSAWGFVGGIIALAIAPLTAFGATPSTLLHIPIFVLEMVLAVWLIVKGFNPSAIASGSAKVS